MGYDTCLPSFPLLSPLCFSIHPSLPSISPSPLSSPLSLASLPRLSPSSFLLSLSLHSLPSLSPVVYNLLRAVVLEPEQGPPRIRLLASAVLRELAPSSSIVVRGFNPPVEESNVPCILPILLAQTNARERLSQMAPTIIRLNSNYILPNLGKEKKGHFPSLVPRMPPHGMGMKLPPIS